MAEIDTRDRWVGPRFLCGDRRAQEALLADLSWLPHSDRLVYAAPGGANGFRAIFDDGPCGSR